LCSDICRKEKEKQRVFTKDRQEQQKKYRKNNRLKLSSHQSVYYEENKISINLKRRSKYAEDPGPAKMQAKKWVQNNKERKIATDKAWVKSNPDKVRSYQHKHRSAKKGNGGSYTSEQWIALCDKYENLCLSCHKRCKLTADHVVPVSKGGTSNIDNIQPLCGPCNSSKGAKSTDFRK
jgi:5-methylcytosine-specific restriction endonuclease McrA